MVAEGKTEIAKDKKLCHMPVVRYLEGLAAGLFHLGCAYEKVQFKEAFIEELHKLVRTLWECTCDHMRARLVRTWCVAWHLWIRYKKRAKLVAVPVEIAVMIDASQKHTRSKVRILQLWADWTAKTRTFPPHYHPASPLRLITQV